MLVLSRKAGEHILIGDNIRITVVGIQGRQVRIGIEAPSEVPVFREEVIFGKERGAEGARAVVGAGATTPPRLSKSGDGSPEHGLSTLR